MAGLGPTANKRQSFIIKGRFIFLQLKDRIRFLGLEWRFLVIFLKMLAEEPRTAQSFYSSHLY